MNENTTTGIFVLVMIALTLYSFISFLVDRKLPYFLQDHNQNTIYIEQ